ncbi:MAG TPA: sialidase family protein [Candidatus Eisenbacteria bacterium]|nr:sialidase family protein [Candidatus Eisenbacteria bacterium]
MAHIPLVCPSAFNVAVAGLALIAGAADAHGTDAFRRARYVQQISADPFAGAGGSQADTQLQPSVAVDPADPSVVVAVFAQGHFNTGGHVDPGFATSHDGGRTWATGNLPDLTVAVGGSFELAADPEVTFGPDGSVYALTTGVDRAPGCRSAVTVQRSDDHGQTFGTPTLIQDDTGCSLFLGFALSDKGRITSDISSVSPRRGRLYGTWTHEDRATFSTPVVLRFSDDRGATWSDLVIVSSTSPLAGGFGATPLVQPNGDLTIVYDDFPLGGASRFVAQTSRSGGLDFEAPVLIADDQSREVPGLSTKGGGVTFVGAAVDPVRGALFVVWQDGRLRTDGRNDIVLSRSTDGGARWDPPALVNADPGRVRNHFTPGVAAYDGMVVVTYTTRDGDAPWVQTRASVSADGGTTFGRPHRLGPRGDLRFASTSGDRAILGDTMEVTLHGDTAHAVWARPAAATRNSSVPYHQRTWAAAISLRSTLGSAGNK